MASFHGPEGPFFHPAALPTAEGASTRHTKARDGGPGLCHMSLAILRRKGG
jgi:hypothetical protein